MTDDLKRRSNVLSLGLQLFSQPIHINRVAKYPTSWSRDSLWKNLHKTVYTNKSNAKILTQLHFENLVSK